MSIATAAAAGLRVVASIDVRTTQDDSHPQRAVQKFSAWHNGYFMALMQRSQSVGAVATS